MYKYIIYSVFKVPVRKIITYDIHLNKYLREIQRRIKPFIVQSWVEAITVTESL